MQFEVDKDELENFAANFWKAAGNARVFAFHGEMGAGKTTTISALCKSMGVNEPTGSPTFSIINEYEGSGKETGPVRIFHIDLYRLEEDSEILQAGVDDCITSGDYCFVEWPEKAYWLFDKNAMHVYITVVSDKRRNINIKRDAVWNSDSVG